MVDAVYLSENNIKTVKSVQNVNSEKINTSIHCNHLCYNNIILIL